jgi:hypothetical protein
MQRAGVVIALLCAVAASATAQSPRSIDPGMSQAQVIERLGEPDLSRASGDFTYLFYRNGCVRACGMDDVVILEKNAVVDAMFRAADRTYTGKSSSPRAIPADLAARTRPGAREVPAAEVVQEGAPKAARASDMVAPPDQDSANEPSVGKKAQKAQPAPATGADTARRDSIMKGSLRIKVMPKNFSPPGRDSARSDSVAKRPPHEE